jgi:photosystem II stability/assembly factor-like uncharacterized protein
VSLEKELRDAFARAADTVVPAPEPYQRLISRRQQRAHQRLGIAGVVVLAVLIAGVGGTAVRLRPKRTGPVTPAPSDIRLLPQGPDRILWADAVGPNFLNASVERCGRNCETILYGSDDGGRTWARRSSDSPSSLTTLPGGALIGWLGGPDAKDLRISTDGGRTWTKITTTSQPVAAVPAGGYAMCPMRYGETMTCTVYAVDLVKHRAAPLRAQPALGAVFSSDITPDSLGGPGTLWAMGSAHGQWQGLAVAVSWDNGRTWHTKTVDPTCQPDISYLPWHSGTNGRVTCTGKSFSDRRLYRSRDSGRNWQRLTVPGQPFANDPNLSRLSFAPDGSLLAAQAPSNGKAGGIWRLPDGADSWQQVPTGELPKDWAGPVAATDGGLLVPGRDKPLRMYYTPDLRTWRQLTLPAK